MDPLLVAFGGLALFMLLFVIGLGVWHPRSGRDIVGGSLRSDEADAEIEQHDIDDMIEALDERRRARGKQPIGDQLAEEIRREQP